MLFEPVSHEIRLERQPGDGLDLPSIIHPGGLMEWHDEDTRWHRDNGPAIIYSNGNRLWYQHGQLHREDGPARIRYDGSRWYYRYGEIHREDGPAAILNGCLEWYINGRLHREDGPARIKGRFKISKGHNPTEEDIAGWKETGQVDDWAYYRDGQLLTQGDPEG